MKKSPIILIALALLALVGSTYAANLGTSDGSGTDSSTVTVTTQTSLTSETPITDVSVSNVVQQDGVTVSESTTAVPVAATSAPIVDSLDLEQQAKMAVMARATTQEMPAEIGGFIGLMFLFRILMFVVGILFSIFWLWMLIDAVKNETEQKALWIIVLFITNGLGAILYYFMVKKPRDKAKKATELLAQANPVTPSETVVTSPELTSVNSAPVVSPTETVEPTPEASSDQPSTPVS